MGDGDTGTLVAPRTGGQEQVVEGPMREVRRAGDAFRCPVCRVGWIHLPPLVPAHGHARVVRCDRCRTLYRVRGAAGPDGDQPVHERGDRDSQAVE